MTPDSTRRALLAAACITTPIFGMVAACSNELHQAARVWFPADLTRVGLRLARHARIVANPASDLIDGHSVSLAKVRSAESGGSLYAEGGEEILVQFHPHGVAGVDLDSGHPSQVAGSRVTDRGSEPCPIASEPAQDADEAWL